MGFRLRSWWGGVAVVVCVLAPRLAHAEGPTAAQDAQAEDLFQRAKAEMLKKNFKDACPMFAESYGLAGGGGTLQNLALCYEDEGKLAFAYTRFNELRAMSLKEGNRPERVKLAEEHIEKLKPRLSRIRVRLADKPPGTKLGVDGDEFGEASWEAGIVVNRGTHTVRVSAPGKKPREIVATVTEEGKLTTVEVPALETDTSAAGPAPNVPTPEPKAVSTQRNVGYVLAGTGAAVAFAGGVFGILTITTNSAATNACTDATPGRALSQNPNAPGATFGANGKCYSDTPDYARANELHDRARTFGTVSSILLPVGVVAAALGAYFVFSAPTDTKPAVSARVVPTLGGLVLSGEFQ